jgi:hypothetical protein
LMAADSNPGSIVRNRLGVTYPFDRISSGERQEVKLLCRANRAWPFAQVSVCRR